MKKVFNIRNLTILIVIVSLILFLYSVFVREINVYVTYISLFLVGSGITLLISFIFTNNTTKRTKWLEERLKLWNSISYKVKVAGEKTFRDMPVGIIVYNDEKVIEWANNYAKQIFSCPTLVEKEMSRLNKELYNKILLYESFDIELYDKIFSCEVIKNDNIVFLLDKTDLRSLEKVYDSKILGMGIINLDNLDQALSVLDPQEKIVQISNIMGILAEWCDIHKIYLRGYSEEQYLIILPKAKVEELMREEFKVINDVYEYCTKENLKITVSIGLACYDIPIVDLATKTDELLNLALQRGGNQAVVGMDKDISYFGGKTNSIENRSPIYVRVKTEELVDLIQKSSNVVIMSHSDMDADAFGSSIAMHKLVRSYEKECKIVFDEKNIDQTVSIVYSEIKKEHINLMDMFVLPHEAMNLIGDETLLIVMDCQYEHMVTNPRLIKKAKRLAILDHHRRSTSAINEYQFLYNQTSASSTVELVIEMYEFVNHEIEFTQMEASLMMMGVIVDTSNLMYRTSYRTYNILGRLQKRGAEIAKVQRYLRENFDKYVERMTILSNLEIVFGNYGIAVCSEEDIYQRQFLAKIADNVITINNIKAAFCIGKIGENEVGISARSLDETNVQTIMEKLGGGGHFNNAATQIVGKTLEEVKNDLIEVLRKNEPSEEKEMKIILTKDVKGKGKKGDIVDIPAGHANYLIKSDQAMLATPDNIKMAEDKNAKEKELAEKHLQEMRKLKEVIEVSPIKVLVKTGKEGKLFGSVSTKQIVDEFKDTYDIVLDKRKIVYDKDIDALGTYKIPIQLHKEVQAVITVYVTEKE